MSKTLLKNNNILVKWEWYQYTTAVSHDPLDWNKKIVWIKLDFTFMVNWKLSTFQEYFDLDESDDAYKTKLYKIAESEYKKWDTLVNVLCSMWYYITETKSDCISEDDIFSKSIIEWWVNDIYPTPIETHN